MAHCLATDERLTYFLHGNSALNSGFNTVTLKRFLQRKRVHNGCQHANVVCLRAIHAFGCARHTTEDVAATNDNAQLNAVNNIYQLFSKVANNLGVNAVVAVAHQRFAGKLQKHAFVSDVGQNDPPFNRLTI